MTHTAAATIRETLTAVWSRSKLPCPTDHTSVSPLQRTDIAGAFCRVAVMLQRFNIPAPDQSQPQ